MLNALKIAACQKEIPSSCLTCAARNAITTGRVIMNSDLRIVWDEEVLSVLK
jgi:hypothetical protein